MTYDRASELFMTAVSHLLVSCNFKIDHLC